MQQQCMYVNHMNTIYRVIIVAKWSAARSEYERKIVEKKREKASEKVLKL